MTRTEAAPAAPAAQHPVPPIAAALSNNTLELHAHLFMKEGMGFAFHGDFNEPLQARTYEDGLSSQANPETVEASGIGILVISLYANPFFERSLRDSIRRQIALAQGFVAAHPNWIIAHRPAEARAALAEGRHALVLSIEGASGILETEDDLREFVDRDGVAIVTLLHLTDDEYGGVALLKGHRVLSDPWAWIRSLFAPNRAEGVKTNLTGLSEEGNRFAHALIAHGVWIDLAHASDASQRDLIPLLRQEGLPLLYTHTVLRHYHEAERGISGAQLAEVARSDGIVGLIPSAEMLEGTPELGTEVSAGAGESSAAPCRASIGELTRQYEEIARVLPADHLGFGTDFNGALNHLEPAPACAGFAGMWNISQVPGIWDALARLGAPVPKPRARMLEAFLQAWERVRK